MKPAASSKQPGSHHPHDQQQPPMSRAASANVEHNDAIAASANVSSDVAALAETILRAIQSSARGRNSAEHREATRYHYCVPMTLHIDDPRKPGTRVVRAASSNISTGGFAFIFDAAISPGSTVRAQFDSLPGKPQIAGLVRSCVRICGTQHRIGVEYQ